MEDGHDRVEPTGGSDVHREPLIDARLIRVPHRILDGRVRAHAELIGGFERRSDGRARGRRRQRGHRLGVGEVVVRRRRRGSRPGRAADPCRTRWPRRAQCGVRPRRPRRGSAGHRQRARTEHHERRSRRPAHPSQALSPRVPRRVPRHSCGSLIFPARPLVSPRTRLSCDIWSNQLGLKRRVGLEVARDGERSSPRRDTWQLHRAALRARLLAAAS